MSSLIEILIALIVLAFVIWAVRAVVAILPLDAFLKQVIDVLITIVIVGVVIFYVVIPLLHILVAHAPSLHF
jgi:hypothetical protein